MGQHFHIVVIYAFLGDMFPALFFVCSVCLSTSVAKLNFITVTPGKTLPAVGGYAITPAYLVAIEDMAGKYPGIYRNTTVVSVDVEAPRNDNLCTFSSDGIALGQLLQADGGEIIQKTELTVVLSSLCSSAFAAVGDFFREENILVLSCASSVGDLERFSTTTTVQRGTSYHEYGIPIAGLMDEFGWKTLVMFVDSASAARNAARVAAEERYITKHLLEMRNDINLLVVKVDSNKQKDPYPAALRRAANHSRIFFCVTFAQQFKNILTTATKLEQGSGDYVFIYSWDMEVPSDPPPEWTHAEIDDMKTREILRSTILISPPLVDWNKARSLAKRIVRKGVEHYNISYSAENELNEYAIACYESVDLISQILWEQDMETFNPADVLRRIRGRTFQFGIRNATFAPDGTRPMVYLLRKFDPSNDVFKVIAEFNYTSKRWYEGNGSDILWSYENVPPDRPRCGLQGDRCLNVSFVETTGGIAIICACVVFILAVFFSLTFFRFREVDCRESDWWILSNDSGLHTSG